MATPLERFRMRAGDVLLLWGWRANATAFLAGGLFALGLPPLDLFFFGFLALPILVLLLDGATTDDPSQGAGGRFRKGFVRGWWFGTGYFLVSLWWVATSFLVDGGLLLLLLPFAMVLLPMGLALFTGLGCGLASIAWHEGPQRLLLLAGALGATEWLRGNVLTGFPWNLYGMPAMMHPLGMQSSSVLGIYGVTVVALFVFAAPVLLIEPRRQPVLSSKSFDRRRFWVGSFALILALAHIGFGAWRLATTEITYQPNVALRVVQPNLNQVDKWKPELADEHFQSYLKLSDRATSPQTIGALSFTHIIWPETAFPFLLTERPDALVALADLIPDETVLLTGANRLERSADEETASRVYNSIYAINGSGEIIAAQDKVRLVPFGEYIPFAQFLDIFGLSPIAANDFGFAAGAVRNVMSLPGTPALLPLICYEIIFPNARAQSAETGRPEWILNVTNDAWFGATPGPHQHLRHAQIRAASDGLPVVRAANTGISAVIDPLGRITHRLPLGEAGTLDSALPQPVASPLTPLGQKDHTDADDLKPWLLSSSFILICLIVIFCLLGGMRRLR
ncbi:MAG: apolipoprotein N-acyltransferase [Pseudomonadota bacterium]